MKPRKRLARYSLDDRYGFVPKKNIPQRRTATYREYEITDGVCPCGVCNHATMLECEENDCQCCSEMCT